jgi:hypothetical protein
VTQPTLDDDFDNVIRSRAGRRVLASIIAGGDVPQPFRTDPLETAFNLGLVSHSRALSDRLKAINLEAWMLMVREISNPDE